MKHMSITNEVKFEGNISFIDLKNGNDGQYGVIGIIQEKTVKNPSNGQEVTKKAIVNLKVSSKFLGAFKYAAPLKGDRIFVEAELVTEFWTPQGSNKEQSALRVVGTKLVHHTPKAVIELCRANGLLPPVSQGGFQQNQSQGGFQQQSYPQGGFQQNQSQGGFQQQSYPQKGPMHNQHS